MLIYRHKSVAYRTQVLRKNTVITSNFIQCLCLLLYEILVIILHNTEDFHVTVRSDDFSVLHVHTTEMF